VTGHIIFDDNVTTLEREVDSNADDELDNHVDTAFEVGGRRVLEVDADSADETFFEGIGKLSTVGGALR
jgi:hypothetical protein